MEPLNNYLGQRCIDKITGLTGICTGICVYISGCNQVLLAPGCKEDGSLVSSEWFDQQRVTITEGKPITLDNDETPGFDKPAPKR
jgi:hypothetical protein